MSQTNWIILVVVIVLVLVVGYIYWPGGDDGAMAPTEPPVAEQPADAEPAPSE